MTPVILIMTKAPVPGQVKTRLTPQLSPHQAAAVAAAALLDTLGLPAALQHLGSELDDGRTAYDVHISGPEAALPDEAKTVLFRVAQEALANIGKHARAARVQIALDFEADGGVALQINDDGRGFEVGPPLPSQGIGLRNMRERVAAIGGRFEIQSSPGHGTQLTADVSRDALARLQTGLHTLHA